MSLAPSLPRPLIRRMVLPALLGASCLALVMPARAQTSQLCAADLNGNGDAADPSEKLHSHGGLCLSLPTRTDGLHHRCAGRL